MSNIRLSSKEAMQYIMRELGYTSLYSIAKELTDNDITVQPIQISNYLKGKHVMSSKVAFQVYNTFDIEITDVHNSKGRPPEW